MREIIDILTGHYRDAAVVAAARSSAGRESGGEGAAAVRQGLRKARKELPSRLLYDRRGLDLLAALGTAPEHYQARAELVLLRTYGRALADLVGDGASLVELGGCDAPKARMLLAELRHPLVYMPIGEAAQVLWSAAMQLQLDYPYLAVRPVISDYATLSELPDDGPWAHEQVAMTLLGGALGAYQPVAAVGLMRRIGRLSRRNVLLVGVDLKTDVVAMEAAYNDAGGLAAEFNANVLSRLNREYGGEFDAAAFRHVAYWNDTCGRIEMYLESRKRQVVRVAGDAVSFDRGELVHTLSSYKYTTGQLQRLGARAGYLTTKAWVDPARRYCLHAYCHADAASH